MAVGVRELGYGVPQIACNRLEGIAYSEVGPEWKVIDGSAANHHSDNPPPLVSAWVLQSFWINVLLILASYRDHPRDLGD